MIKKNSNPPNMNKFGVEPRDLTAAQRRELFTDYKNSHPDPMAGTDYYDDPPSVKPARPVNEDHDEF